MSVAKMEGQVTTVLLVLLVAGIGYFVFGSTIRKWVAGALYTVSQAGRDVAGWVEKPLIGGGPGATVIVASSPMDIPIPGTGFTANELTEMGYTPEQLAVIYGDPSAYGEGS